MDSQENCYCVVAESNNVIRRNRTINYIQEWAKRTTVFHRMIRDTLPGTLKKYLLRRSFGLCIVPRTIIGRVGNPDSGRPFCLLGHKTHNPSTHSSCLHVPATLLIAWLGCSLACGALGPDCDTTSHRRARVKTETSSLLLAGRGPRKTNERMPCMMDGVIGFPPKNVTRHESRSA